MATKNYGNGANYQRQEHEYREPHHETDHGKRRNPLRQEKLLDDGNNDLGDTPGDRPINGRRLDDLSSAKLGKERVRGHGSNLALVIAHQ